MLFQFLRSNNLHKISAITTFAIINNLLYTKFMTFTQLFFFSIFGDYCNDLLNKITKSFQLTNIKST